MGKIVVSENLSLDGVAQDPAGEEGFRHGGWFGQFGAQDLEQWARTATAEALRSDALLLGRRSEQWFAARWPSRTGDWADRLNSMPKYVVSSTHSEATWSNVTVLAGDAAANAARLRQELAGDIVVYASLRLVHTLIEHDLVDEFRLTVFPVMLGSGHRLFAETSDKRPLRLTSTQTLGESLALLTYERARNA